MSLQDPVAIYYANTNTEATLLCHILEQAGIEAHLMEDLSLAGLWMGGTAPNIHMPKVWVDKANEERATVVLKDYEQSLVDRDPGRAQAAGDETFVQAVCEECGKTSMFTGRMLGSVQECPACGKFMDVESADDRENAGDDWGEEEGTDARE